MLQLRALHTDAVGRLYRSGALPVGPVPAEHLQDAARRAIDSVREERRRLARSHGRLTWIRERLDRRLRTDEIEYLDDPRVEEDEKCRMIADLHRHNQIVGAYPRFAGILRPLLREAAARRGGPARLLELASGYGEMALQLAVRNRRWGVEVEVSGSDIVASYVASANERAQQRKLPVRFAELDALRLDGVEPGSVDVVLVAQSVHHFDPGQLAAMIAASARIATTAFVAIDGFRTAALFPLLLGTTTLLPRISHDSFLSARRFYSEPELGLIAALAVGSGGVRVWTSVPGWSVLEVRPPGAAGGTRLPSSRA